MPAAIRKKIHLRTLGMRPERYKTQAMPAAICEKRPLRKLGMRPEKV